MDEHTTDRHAGGADIATRTEQLAGVDKALARAREQRRTQLLEPFLTFLARQTHRDVEEFHCVDTLTELERRRREGPWPGSMGREYTSARFDTDDHVRWVVNQFHYPHGWTALEAHVFLTVCPDCQRDIVTPGTGVDDLVALRTFRLEDSLPEGIHRCSRTSRDLLRNAWRLFVHGAPSPGRD